MLLMGWDLARAAEPAAAASAAAASSAPASASGTGPAATPAATPAALFQQHCASCHGAQRTGGMGPALLPESLSRLKPAEARQVITHGRPATQMPAFGSTLSAQQIEQLAAHLYTPVVPVPSWGEADIRGSRTFDAQSRNWPAQPSWRADPMNLFVVVEGGDHHVSLVDGDRFEVIHRFPSRYALHGGPKFSPEGRYVYFGSRDGWITKYDLWNLRVVAEVRAGLNMRNVAVSSDGRYVLAGNWLPHTAVLFDADLNLVKVIPAAKLDGSASSRVSAVYDAQPRKSFIVALKDLPELWEISYDPQAAPIHDGLVHDFRMGEAIAKTGFLGVRRTPLSEPLDDFFFDPGYRHVIGAMRPAATARGKAPAASAASPVASAAVAAASPTSAASAAASDAPPTAQVINLDARTRVASLPLPGLPHLGSGIAFDWQGRTVIATPDLQQGVIAVIDPKTWRIVTQIQTPGPGFFMRSHAASRYAWTDSMMSPAAKHRMTLIDKTTLKPAREVSIEPGKTLAHIEFTRDGRYALASLWEDDGALIVYDAATLREVKRLPMRKPVGKYNIGNKLAREEGTSH
ncbi:MAG: nitrite reductase [Aquabacterium sp.]|nr:nitrite reductase [Aquabacterium sp.]